MSASGRRIEIRGTVQGVGFRPFVFRAAHEAGVAGRVRNGPGGVTIEAFGTERALEAFVGRLRDAAPPAARVRSLRAEPIPPEEAREFVIVPSEGAGERRVSIPPDLATCDACAAEIGDPGDRRHRYAFTNCTDCGPRFTIALDVPYDRPATTMAPFPMCPECRREYEDPLDRRFHAQPNACPRCGPRLALLGPEGAPLAEEDPLSAAARALAEGAIVAVKGLGGFHLACDATSASAVARLRRRKRRDEKPFAVMVRDLAEARAIACAGAAEARLLTSTERPIVLLRRRPGSAARLAPEVAPGSAFVGLMLPYTPLHHLLLAEAARPLVMTSGNLSDEPIAYRNDEAVARLRGIADLFLVHDREIASRCDDSVARVVAGGAVVLRRSRGYVPRAIRLARPVPAPILAVGAQLKNAVCLVEGDRAYLGPHVGDLENLAAYEALERSVERMERFCGIRPRAIAHDLHPDYLSTRYARRRGGPLVAVQHHHAHVLSAMAERGVTGPVLGLAWDGTGLGTDRAAWGGELLLVRPERFERLATLRPIPLAGGERAIREVWRLALAALDDAYGGAAPALRFPLFARVGEARVAAVRRLLRSGLACPAAHGAGRQFDAAGALLFAREKSAFEGQVALALNGVADPREKESYPFRIDRERRPWEVDTRPLHRALAEDVLAGRPTAEVAARFHATLAEIGAALVREAARRVGRLPVVLTGGCFQNDLLAEGVARRLAPAFDVILHGEVPPGDGGLALGQAVAAGARLRRGG